MWYHERDDDFHSSLHIVVFSEEEGAKFPLYECPTQFCQV
jgi:hypothetical protein